MSVVSWRWWPAPLRPAGPDADVWRVLNWLAVGLAAACLGVGLRWALTRVDALGRTRAFPWISVVLLVLGAIGAAVPGFQRQAEENRLAKVASALAGIRVSVHCQTFGSAMVDAGSEFGYVKYGANGVMEHSTLIKHEQCGFLAAYLSSSKHHPSADQVEAVHVLTHESMHMAGIASESGAECAAIQRDAMAARLLGAAPQDALALAVTYWQTVYPVMPTDYRSTDCAPGGRLDERRGDGPWATG